MECQAIFHGICQNVIHHPMANLLHFSFSYEYLYPGCENAKPDGQKGSIIETGVQASA
jgi:hypothetical protein